MCMSVRTCACLICFRIRGVLDSAYILISDSRVQGLLNTWSQGGQKFFLFPIYVLYVFCFCPVTQLCLMLCEPIDCSMPGIPVLLYLPEFAKTHVHQVSDAIQPSHPLLPALPPALSLSQHQRLFQ